MTLLHELITSSAQAGPDRTALWFGGDRTSYAELAALVQRVANGFVALGVRRSDRVAIFLPKRLETVAAMFGASAAGAAFVPVNPVLKPPQVAHILRDSGARVLITTAQRAQAMAAELVACSQLEHIVVVDGGELEDRRAMRWEALLDSPAASVRLMIDSDLAAILYTSGSTGKPKGVVLTQRNMVVGAHSVASYLANRASDRLLAVLPFSFDYGFSQLSTAFSSGASVALIEYLLPRDVLLALQRYEITGLAAVPPLWIQLAPLEWPLAARERLRYITNSGGAMPTATLATLRGKLPQTSVFLMYGLTEAFRSTYLPPDQVEARPGSIGKAIPHAEVLVVRSDGGLCAPGEAGELVHRGPLVSRGYWNAPEQTAQRFRPAPGQPPELMVPEIAVWSGDTVVRDEEGYLYFVGRRDEMIKTSGYRVSPTEIEEVLYSTGLVAEAVIVGAPHPTLGQGIVVVAVSQRGAEPSSETLLAACRAALPTYMVPTHIEWRDSLPRNANGKIDRPTVAAAFAELFAGGAS